MRARAPVRLFGLAGWSGSGKTTLVRQLLPVFTACGITVSTVKHAHHSFDVDQPGKDSWHHRQGGATEVMVASAQRWALMHEHRGAAEPPLDELLRHMTPVDLVLVEGFKRTVLPKLEVHRPALGKPLLCHDDPQVIAIATDAPLHGLPVPQLRLDDVRGIAELIIAHCRLEPMAHGAAER